MITCDDSVIQFEPDASGRSKESGGDLLIEVKLENTSEDVTVDAVDIAIYCTNVYGEPLYPDDYEDGYIRHFSLDKTYKPGKSGYTGYCRMEGCAKAKEYYVAITRYHTRDYQWVGYERTDGKGVNKYVTKENARRLQPGKAEYKHVYVQNFQVVLSLSDEGGWSDSAMLDEREWICRVRK